MNYIKQLQAKVERQQEVIDAQKEALLDLRDYAMSDKYSGELATMNPQDVVNRVCDSFRRINDIADNGLAVVDG